MCVPLFGLLFVTLILIPPPRTFKPTKPTIIPPHSIQNPQHPTPYQHIPTHTNTNHTNTYTCTGTSGQEGHTPIQLPGIRDLDPEQDPSQFSYQVSEMSLISALNALKFAQVCIM
mgnify:CR=1 FL=1